MTKHTARFDVPRPLDEYEMADVKQAITNIIAHRSFFFAGDEPLGDEIRAFLVMNPIISNLEFEAETE